MGDKGDRDSEDRFEDKINGDIFPLLRIFCVCDKFDDNFCLTPFVCGSMSMFKKYFLQYLSPQYLFPFSEQPFVCGTKKVEYKCRQWHDTCFHCKVCKTKVNTKLKTKRQKDKKVLGKIPHLQICLVNFNILENLLVYKI